jgi:hypothetical protein
MKFRFMIVALCILGLSACGKKEEAATPAPVTQAPAATTVSPEAAAAAPTSPAPTSAPAVPSAPAAPATK